MISLDWTSVRPRRMCAARGVITVINALTGLVVSATKVADRQRVGMLSSLGEFSIYICIYVLYLEIITHPHVKSTISDLPFNG